MRFPTRTLWLFKSDGALILYRIGNFHNCIFVAWLIPGRLGSFPCVQDQTQYTITEKRLINKVLDIVLIINEFTKGLKIISKIKLIMIIPIFINND